MFFHYRLWTITTITTITTTITITMTTTPTITTTKLLLKRLNYHHIDIYVVGNPQNPMFLETPEQFLGKLYDLSHNQGRRWS